MRNKKENTPDLPRRDIPAGLGVFCVPYLTRFPAHAA